MNKSDGLEVLIRAMGGESTDSIIRDQEARGQTIFVNSTALPKDINWGTREQFEAMGIVFGDDIDDLFIEAQLPEGWEKKSAEHSMWSYLLDDKGRKRAAIFYKAAFYDRSSHMSISRRYSFHIQPLGGYESEEGEKSYGEQVLEGVITDCDKDIIWRTEDIDPQERDIKPFEVRDILEPLCLEWLNNKFPDWENPQAYWDTDT